MHTVREWNFMPGGRKLILYPIYKVGFLVRRIRVVGGDDLEYTCPFNIGIRVVVMVVVEVL